LGSSGGKDAGGEPGTYIPHRWRLEHEGDAGNASGNFMRTRVLHLSLAMGRRRWWTEKAVCKDGEVLTVIGDTPARFMHLVEIGNRVRR
jgi:hypothetical protein